MPQEAPYYTTKTCPFYPPRRTQLIAPRSFPADVPGCGCVLVCNGQNNEKKSKKRGRKGVYYIQQGLFHLGLACAQAAALSTQIAGHSRSRGSRPRAQSLSSGSGSGSSLASNGCSLFCLFVLSACACSSDVTVTSYSHSPSVSLRAILTQPNVLSLTRGEFSWHLPHRNLRRCANGERIVVVVTREPQWLSRCVGLINKLLRRERERALH